ncbi:hypothetical protein ON010_g4200 [Phytophthora cinnamomi]|nr:hypothetical protein ON010_g4200 [Phytophthora cinnamomi]
MQPPTLEVSARVRSSGHQLLAEANLGRLERPSRRAEVAAPAAAAHPGRARAAAARAAGAGAEAAAARDAHAAAAPAGADPATAAGAGPPARGEGAGAPVLDRLWWIRAVNGRTMQQNGRLYDGDFQRTQPVPMRPTTTPTGGRSYAFNYGDDSQAQAGVSAGRNDVLFAPQQVPQPAQSHFRARNTDLFAASTLPSWGSNDSWMTNDSTSLTGMQADKTKPFRMQSEQRFMLQQQQHQPYYPVERSGSSSQEPATREAVGSAPTRTTAVPGRPTGLKGEDRCNTFEFAPAQQTQRPVCMQTQMEMQSRVAVPPTGTVIVPGVSLASPAMRLVTMRDLLNGDDMANKVDQSRGRPRGSQQRAPQKRKTSRKKIPAKRPRMPDQQNEPRPRHAPMNRSVRALLPSQSSSLAPGGGPSSTGKPATPMYLAFMESRAARALEQKSGITSSNPSILRVHTTQSQLSVSTAQPGAGQTNNKSVDLVAGETSAAEQKIPPYKRKKAETPPDTQDEDPYECTSEPPQPPTNPTVFSNKQGRQVSIGDGRLHSDDPTDEKFEQLPKPPRLSVPVNMVESPVNVNTAEVAKLGKSSRRRQTTKISQTGSNTLVMRGEQQQVNVPAKTPTEIVSGADTAAVLAPRVENRTVVIFCKRDFMRYQAAKIWRKYQEQLKKQEEWREVRVAGKRTRYLNSRYDDELRRTHRKPTNKRSGTRSRTKTVKKAEDPNGHDVSSSAGKTAASFTAPVSTSPSNGNDEGNTLANDSGTALASATADSGTMLDTCVVHFPGTKPGVVENGSDVALKGASDSLQERAPLLPVIQDEDQAKCMNGLKELNKSMADSSINAKELSAAVADANAKTAVTAASSTETIGVAADDPDNTAVPSTTDVSLDNGTEFATTALVASGANIKVPVSTTKDNLSSDLTAAASSGSTGTVVSSATVSRQSLEEASNKGTDCSVGESGWQTSTDPKQSCRDTSSHSIEQTCTYAATTSIDGGVSVVTCTDSTTKCITLLDKPASSHGVMTNVNSDSAETMRCDAEPSTDDTIILAKPMSTDLVATNSDSAKSTEIEQCAGSATLDDLNLGVSCTDPVTNSYGDATV